MSLHETACLGVVAAVEWRRNEPKKENGAMVEIEDHASCFRGVKRWLVDLVIWSGATDLCRKLPKRTSQTFNFSTEALWEYACRAEGAEGIVLATAITIDFIRESDQKSDRYP